MNILPMKKYQEIKNKTVTIVSFRDGKRTLTYSGVDYAKAIEHMIEKTKNGEVCLVYKEETQNFLGKEKVVDSLLNDLSSYIG